MRGDQLQLLAMVHNADYSILGSMLGPPYLGKLPLRFRFGVKGVGLPKFRIQASGLAGLACIVHCLSLVCVFRG